MVVYIAKDEGKKAGSNQSAGWPSERETPKLTCASTPHPSAEDHPKEHIPPNPLIDSLHDCPIELRLAEARDETEGYPEGKERLSLRLHQSAVS
jgi:hypothetical protein